MKPSVYLETSFISYLTGPTSQNIITAANQHITHDWWENRRHAFELFISPEVIDEASQGNPSESAKRLAIMKDITLLVLNNKAIDLALAFLQEKGVPSQANDDAYHIAIATVYQMNYLLTWNCKHIANAHIQPKLRQITLKHGYNYYRRTKLCGRTLLWKKSTSIEKHTQRSSIMTCGLSTKTSKPKKNSMN